MRTIFERINQTLPFESIEIEVYLNLLITAEALREKVDEANKVYGVNHYQHNILRILRGAESSLYFDEIVSRMVIKSPDTKEEIDILAERGLLNIIERPAADDIAVSAEITSQGLDLLDHLQKLSNKEVKSQLGFMGEDLLRQFNAMLVLAGKNADEDS